MTLRSRARSCLLPAAAGLAMLAAAALVVIGPWPVYRDSHYAKRAYFQETLARMEASAARSAANAEPGRLHAGWAEVDITPPVGTPLAGYSGRPNEKRSTGIYDSVYARAIVLSDGANFAALVGLDLLMFTPNLAERVWTALHDTPLNRDNILFTVSHTHCGPGGFAPGLVAEFSLGAYDPAIERRLADAIGRAVRDAYESMEPAMMAYRKVEAPAFIFNRTNVEGVDPSLGLFVLEKESGERCIGVRYSAHATVLPETFLEISGDYPGMFARNLANTTEAMVVFLGGAVGAMGPQPPGAEPSAFQNQNLEYLRDLPDPKQPFSQDFLMPPAGNTPPEKMRRMGRALAAAAARKTFFRDSLTPPLAFENRVAIRSLGAEVGMPPLQGRIGSSNDWRFSPFVAKVLGLPTTGWIQAVRIGPMVFIGLPYDVGGPIAAGWAREAEADGTALWISGHCIGYAGYLSPDRHYWDDTEGYDQWYEWRLMNWFGPNQEAMWTDLKDHALQLMTE